MGNGDKELALKTGGIRGEGGELRVGITQEAGGKPDGDFNRYWQ
jgi:hypothetical protein